MVILVQPLNYFVLLVKLIKISNDTKEIKQLLLNYVNEILYWKNVYFQHRWCFTAFFCFTLNKLIPFVAHRHKLPLLWEQIVTRVCMQPWLPKSTAIKDRQELKYYYNLHAHCMYNNDDPLCCFQISILLIRIGL